jgi:hypothetical protein
MRLNKNVGPFILARNLNTNFIEQSSDRNLILGHNLNAEITEQLLQMALIVIKLEKTFTNKNEEHYKNQFSSKILSKALFHYNEKVLWPVV